MPVIFKNLSTSDLNRPSARLVYVETDEDDAPTPIPTTCPTPAELIPVGDIYADDFNRIDGDNMGVDWEQFFDNINPVQNYPWFGIRSNQLRGLADPAAPPPDTSPLTKLGYFLPMPSTVKDQYAQVVFKGSSLVATGGPATSPFGGSFWVCCRCNPNFATGNHWFEAGAGGAGTKTGVVCYFARYSENYSAGGAFTTARMDLFRNELLGFAGLVAGVGVPRLVSGDVVKITAANFIQFGQENVCLKVFINSTQVLAANDFSTPIPNIQAGRQLTGRGGLCSGEDAPDVLQQAFAVAFLLDDFQAQACLPNPT
jgi:hypothetical protein